MPPPAAGVGSGCVVNLLANLTLTSAPSCNVDALGFYFYKTNSAAAPTALSTTEVPASRTGMGMRLGWRYRIR